MFYTKESKCFPGSDKMKKIFIIFNIGILGILGFTTAVQARTQCAEMGCSASDKTCHSGEYYLMLSPEGLPHATGCLRYEPCGEDTYICTAASSGYRLKKGCAPLECPTGCSECCTSSNGKAICTKCESGYESSGDDCVKKANTLPNCKFESSSFYTTKAKCLSNCEATCDNCFNHEKNKEGWECNELPALVCKIEHCKKCNFKMTACESCEAGYYLVDGTCKPCEEGTFSSNPGATKCISCQHGYWSEPGSTSCTKVDCTQFNPHHGRCVSCEHDKCDEIDCYENYEPNYLTNTCESSATVETCRAPFVFDAEQKCCVVPTSDN